MAPAYHIDEATSSKGATMSGTYKSHSSTIAYLQGQFLPPPRTNPSPNSLDMGSSQHTSTLQNNTPNSVHLFFAVQATLVEYLVQSNIQFAELSAPMRDTPVIDAVLVANTKDRSNDDGDFIDKTSINPDSIMSFCKKHWTSLLIGMLLSMIGALVGGIMSLLLIGGNGGGRESSDTITVESPQKQSSAVAQVLIPTN